MCPSACGSSAAAKSPAREDSRRFTAVSSGRRPYSRRRARGPPSGRRVGAGRSGPEAALQPGRACMRGRTRGRVDPHRRPSRLRPACSNVGSTSRNSWHIPPYSSSICPSGSRRTRSFFDSVSGRPADKPTPDADPPGYAAVRTFIPSGAVAPTATSPNGERSESVVSEDTVAEAYAPPFLQATSDARSL